VYLSTSLREKVYDKISIGRIRKIVNPFSNRKWIYMCISQLYNLGFHIADIG
jgi:hypothetical protein